jgi:hypothetical protein
MPYQESGEISILNLTESTINVSLEALVADWEWDSESMYFNAAWHGEDPVATRPYSDWNYVTLEGKGVYVGDALTIMNPVSRWWGEGDEKIWVDGEDFPSLFGTGTEDYYGYSWGGRSNDFYEHPFHAQTFCYQYNKLNRSETVEKNTMGYSTETRTRALDVMPFGSSLQLDMEVWSWTDCDMAYGVGVYWYADSATTSNRTPDPDGVLPLPTLPDELQSEEVDSVAPDVDYFPGPSSFYDFEEDGDVIVDSGTLLNDGSIIGDEVTRVSGGIICDSTETDNCVEFSGTAWAGTLSYIEIPYADIFSSGDYTFTAWIKYTGETNDYGYIFYQGGDVWPEVDEARSVDMWLDKTTTNSELYDADGDKVNTASSSSLDVYDGDWHLVGVSLVKDSAILKLWIDGVLTATTEHTTDFKENETANLWLGARPHKNSTAVKLIGLMDRVRIWDYALSEDQMKLLTFIEGADGGSVDWDWTATAISSVSTDDDISIFPNPFSEAIEVRCESQIKCIQIFDISGVCVHTSFPYSKSTTLNTANLSAGSYIVKVETYDGRILNKKLVK